MSVSTSDEIFGVTRSRTSGPQIASESATRSMLRHDPRGGASFVTFAWHRALGEILDYAERERLRS